MSVVTTIILTTSMGDESRGWGHVQDWLDAERSDDAEGDPNAYYWRWSRLLIMDERERALRDAIEFARAHVSGRRAHGVRESLHVGLATLNGGNKHAQVRIGIGAFNAFGRAGDGGNCDAFIEAVRAAPWWNRGEVVLVIYPEDGAPFVERLTGRAG